MEIPMHYDFVNSPIECEHVINDFLIPQFIDHIPNMSFSEYGVADSWDEPTDWRKFKSAKIYGGFISPTHIELFMDKNPEKGDPHVQVTINAGCDDSKCSSCKISVVIYKYPVIGLNVLLARWDNGKLLSKIETASQRELLIDLCNARMTLAKLEREARR